MSVATTIIIVFALISTYYISMIAYDLYIEKMKAQQATESAEESIDVSDQLSEFESQNISNQDETSNKRRAFFSWMSKGISPEKMNKMMEDAATGTPNADLKNILMMVKQKSDSQE